MKIAIISIYPFPEGLAPTNRIKAYAKGLIANGAKVKVFIPFPTFFYSPFTKYSKSGNVEGIEYLYTSKIYKSKYKIIRGLAVILGLRKSYGYYKTCQSIRTENIDNKIDCLIISTDDILNLYVFSLIANKIKAKKVFIFDEFPIPIRHKLKTKIPWRKICLYKMVLKRMDAYVSISEKLKDYYCDLCYKRSFILSSITDTDRFENVKKIENNSNYICYMGNMELSKDNVDLIIHSFAKFIESENLDVKLFLYGNPNMSDKQKLENIIENYKLDKKVIFKGIATYESVPSILSNAKLLVSSQPNTLRASGGFPTKLGEYLMSGVPVLLSDVGENSKFVTDNKHVFFAKPNSIEDFTAKMEYIFSNYEHAISVAQEGKKYVLNNYSHIEQGKELLKFIFEINNIHNN